MIDSFFELALRGAFFLRELCWGLKDSSALIFRLIRILCFVFYFGVEIVVFFFYGDYIFVIVKLINICLFEVYYILIDKECLGCY